MYNFHFQRQVGDFSYDCTHCAKVIRTSNLCQIVIHLLTDHKISTLAMDKVSFQSYLNVADPVEDVSAADDFDDTAKLNLKKVAEYVFL